MDFGVERGFVQVVMRSNGPVTLSLPPFRGTTRRIVLTAIVVFLVGWVLSWISRDLSDLWMAFLVLEPIQHRLIWHFVTYPFYSLNLLSLLFSLLQVWFFGSALEDERGTPWFAEYFFATTIAGGFVAGMLCLYAMGRFAGFPGDVSTWGLWPGALSLLLAFGYFHPEEPLKVYFILPVKAKYLAWGYLLIYVLGTFFGGDRFGSLTAVCVAVASYAYLRFAPRKGLRYAMSER